MKRFSRSVFFGMLVIGIALVSVNADAQDRRGPRGGFDPEEMRARMMDRMQEVMGSTDEEWKVLEPMVADVMEKQREAGAGRGFGMMMLFRRGDDDGNRRGGPGRGFGPEPSAEIQALQEVLDNEAASASDIQEKLKALRVEREEKQEALEKAQDKLRKVLTVRQEALLVMFGMLE